MTIAFKRVQSSALNPHERAFPDVSERRVSGWINVTTSCFIQIQKHKLLGFLVTWQHQIVRSTSDLILFGVTSCDSDLQGEVKRAVSARVTGHLPRRRREYERAETQTTARSRAQEVSEEKGQIWRAHANAVSSNQHEKMNSWSSSGCWTVLRHTVIQERQKKKPQDTQLWFILLMSCHCFCTNKKEKKASVETDAIIAFINFLKFIFVFHFHVI